jgi:hypothetical protein
MSRGKQRPKETDEELMASATSLYHSIHVEECFGTGDLCRYEATIRKLEQRGYRVTTTVAFSKEE